MVLPMRDVTAAARSPPLCSDAGGRLSQSLSSCPDAAEKTLNSSRQTFRCFHRIHNHLPGGCDWAHRILRQRMSKHSGLAGLLQLRDCGQLRDANPEHLDARSVEIANITADRKKRHQPVRRHRAIHPKSTSRNQRCGRQVLSWQQRRCLDPRPDARRRIVEQATRTQRLARHKSNGFCLLAQNGSAN